DCLAACRDRRAAGRPHGRPHRYGSECPRLSRRNGTCRSGRSGGCLHVAFGGDYGVDTSAPLSTPTQDSHLWGATREHASGMRGTGAASDGVGALGGGKRCLPARLRDWAEEPPTRCSPGAPSTKRTTRELSAKPLAEIKERVIIWRIGDNLACAGVSDRWQ